MNTYKYTSGRFGIDEEFYLTDIETGIHCLGYIINRDTGEESENQTELKLPEDIDGFSIDLPNGSIWLKKGYDRFPFGRVYIKYYDASNICVINPYKSFYWAEKASQNGYIWEWQRIGFAYLYGDATGKNYKKAIYWFKKICNLPKDLRINCTDKYGEILYCLGYFSFYGIGTKKDLHLAFGYFTKSADEGYYLACEALAYF